jgi:hypothetical protein
MIHFEIQTQKWNLDLRLDGLRGWKWMFQNFIFGTEFQNGSLVGPIWSTNQQITDEYKFPIFGASPIGERTWKNENFKRPL